MENYTRLFDIIYYQSAHFPQAESIGQRVENTWEFYSTQEVIDLMNQLSLGLLELGLEKGDKISLVDYKNRPEWKIVELAALQIGLVTVPVYPTISAKDFKYIFNDAGVKYIFAGDKELVKKIKGVAPEVPSYKGCFTFEKEQGESHWKSLLRKGETSVIKTVSDTIKPEELAVLIYTSGTTGLPKGVMLSHKNIISCVNGARRLLPLDAGDKVLSFLPLCHIFECAVSYTYLSMGLSTGFTGVRNLGGEEGDIRSLAPTFFTSVPRLLEKVYEKIYNKGLELKGIKKKLFFWALGIAEKYEFKQKPTWKTKLADKLIFSKWREALGGNLKLILTGAAPCSERLVRVFSCAGISVREAYGLTETSPGITINYFDEDNAMIGTVGLPFQGMEVKLDMTNGDYKEGEGEILTKGDSVMLGYYNQPEKTAEVLDSEGWLRTGDIGKFVYKDGKEFLKITDRKKELLKTSGGKYVAPSPIENKFKEDFLIEQMMVIGDRRKFVSALIVPAAQALKNWCDENQIPCKITPKNEEETIFSISPETLENEKVIAHFQGIFNEYNPLFSKVERVKKFKLLAEPWDVSTGELTPTMKLKRRVVLEKYKNEIEGLYL